MIKYETIISNFDDKTTLYNWLRKVEEALKNASATNFVVNKKGNATLSFSITFADGTTLESGDIVLQQGESVDQARIASGILQLHLTNGTWLTAGNIKPVSNFSIDANQHLIVNYQDGTSQDLGAIFNGNITISGDLAVTGDITGPKVDCTLVTGDEIVEKMTGYTPYKGGTSAGFSYDYIGICKNGNKLTFVLSGSFTPTAQTPSSVTIASIYVPAEVASKLVNNGLGALEYNVMRFYKDFTTYVEKTLAIVKRNDGSIAISIYGATTGFEIGETYYYRIESTMLLSENYA